MFCAKHAQLYLAALRGESATMNSGLAHKPYKRLVAFGLAWVAGLSFALLVGRLRSLLAVQVWSAALKISSCKKFCVATILLQGGDFASIPHIAVTHIRANYIRSVFRFRSHIPFISGHIHDWLY